MVLSHIRNILDGFNTIQGLTVKLILFFTYIFLLTGCASSTLGPIATYESKSIKPQLDISGRFNTDMCSDNFAYLNLSIENKSTEWKKLQDLKLIFPYGQRNKFEIVLGEKLASWAVAEEARQGRENHNSQMAKLAAAGLGIGLLGSSNSRSSVAGAAIVSGVVASNEAERISNSKEQAEAGNSQHILQGDLLIPPKMDRQYWLLLSAHPDAPLMDHIKLAYQDENKNSHRFKVEMTNWTGCKWQRNRIKQLKDWAMANRHTKGMKRFVQGNEVANKQVGKIEAFLQDYLKPQSAHFNN